MKYILLKFFSFSIFVTVLSCNDRYGENQPADKFELNKLVKLKHNTDKVSDNFLNMGVTEIKVTSESNSLIYKAKTEKNFNLNGENIDLSNYEFVLKDGRISLVSNPRFELTIYQNKPFIISDSFTGFADEDCFKDNNFNVLLLFMKELTTDSDFKMSSKTAIDVQNLKSASCSFLNTYYVFSTGGSRAVAAYNLIYEVKEYGDQLEGCHTIGGSDSSCLWENHGCIATQAFCCK